MKKNISNSPGVILFTVFVFLTVFTSLDAQTDKKEEDNREKPPMHRISEWLVAPLAGGNKGHVTASGVAKRYVLKPGTHTPTAGKNEPGLRASWTKVKTNNNSVVKHKHLTNGYAYGEINSEKERILLSRFKGNYVTYVNGAGHVGDFYRKRQAPIPLHLREGKNQIFVRTIRKKFKFELFRPESDLLLAKADPTLPDVRVGQPLDAWGGVLVVNATTEPLKNIQIVSGGNDSRFKKHSRTIDFLPPASIRKVPVRIELTEPVHEKNQKTLPLPVRIKKEELEHGKTFNLRIRKLKKAFKQTFLSPIDRSVQYYSVVPPLNPDEDHENPSLVLTLHGASVKVNGSVGYTPKENMYIVAPTNRRPFGFDWEDWGRANALHVLDRVMEKFSVNPNRVYLAGHSMGGHGVWHVGITYPGRFAAIGPSAGWISLFGYASRSKPSNSGPGKLIWRCMGSSDTLSVLKNLKDLPIYIIHGSKDNNVPVKQSRTMVEKLKSFHKDFEYHEENGAGHWWNDKSTPGADCVNWPPLFDFFNRHRRNESPSKLDFSTWNPAISAERRWIRVIRQEKLLKRSRIRAEAVPHGEKITVKTKNIARFSLDPSSNFQAGSLNITIDGRELSVDWNGEKPVEFRKAEKGWAVAGKPQPESWKSPVRYGPFKRAFRKGFVLVYGTRGTAAENRVSRERARFDAQVWWYRGNGGAKVIPDSRFDPARYSGRNVILYGNEDCNSAFEKVLNNSPVRVRRGKMVIGDRTYNGKDLSCFFIRPRKKHPENLVGVVGGTGEYGIRASYIETYIRSGKQYPDFYVWDRRGTGKKESFKLVATGIFGPDWSLDSGDTWFSKK